MNVLLIILDTILGVGTVILIFMHSGKDAGLSGAFGGGMQQFGGTSVVQKNLDRLTILFAGLFFAVTVVLGFVL